MWDALGIPRSLDGTASSPFRLRRVGQGAEAEDGDLDQAVVPF